MNRLPKIKLLDKGVRKGGEKKRGQNSLQLIPTSEFIFSMLLKLAQ